LVELGGVGPFIIFADADIDRAVEGAINDCFYDSGQVCTSAGRLLVHEAVHDEFVEKFTKRARQLKIGSPALETMQTGPLCNAATLARVKAHVEDARAEGAEIEQIGPQDELYFPATIVTGVTTDMLIAHVEILTRPPRSSRSPRRMRRSASRIRPVSARSPRSGRVILPRLGRSARRCLWGR